MVFLNLLLLSKIRMNGMIQLDNKYLVHGKRFGFVRGLLIFPASSQMVENVAFKNLATVLNTD